MLLVYKGSAAPPAELVAENRQCPTHQEYRASFRRGGGGILQTQGVDREIAQIIAAIAAGPCRGQVEDRSGNLGHGVNGSDVDGVALRVAGHRFRAEESQAAVKLNLCRKLAHRVGLNRRARAIPCGEN